jgi:hypothetical protein
VFHCARRSQQCDHRTSERDSACCLSIGGLRACNSLNQRTIESHWNDEAPRCAVRSMRGKGKREKRKRSAGRGRRGAVGGAGLRCTALRTAASSRAPALLRQPHGQLVLSPTWARWRISLQPPACTASAAHGAHGDQAATAITNPRHHARVFTIRERNAAQRP